MGFNFQGGYSHVGRGMALSSTLNCILLYADKLINDGEKY